MAQQILVQFQGEGCGVGELSWGQRELWYSMRRKHDWMPIGAVSPLPAGTTIEDVADDLRFLMSRYQTMRTLLREDPDGTKQVVSCSGTVPLEIVDADRDADPAEVAERVRRRYWEAEYDYFGEWPVRMAVIRHRGVVTHRVWVMCHLVTDGFGAMLMVSELADRDTSASDAALSPLEQARWQQSPAGQRQCEQALQHWERLLRRIPARRFPPRDDRPRPRYRNASLTSQAMRLAVRTIAARTGAPTSAVLLAAFAVALARATGINPVVTRVTVGNRFRPTLADTVSPIIHNGLCQLDVAGITFDEAVARARHRAMIAYKYAYYDPPQLDELVDQVCRERGEEVDIGCFFNDRRLQRPDETGPPSPPEQIEAALPLSSFGWDGGQDAIPYDRLFLNIDDVPDTQAVSVYIDTWYVSPDTAEACVRGMEAVTVAAASDPSAPTRVGQAPARAP